MVREQIGLIEQARLERIAQAPTTGPNAMVRLVASIVGVGVDQTPQASGPPEPASALE